METKQVQTSQQPTPPPSAHKLRFLPMLLGAILLLGIGAVIGYLFAMSTKSAVTPTGNERVHIVPTDVPPTKLPEASFSKLGITFQYPSTIKLVKEDSNENTPGATIKQSTVKFSLDGKEFDLDRSTDTPKNELPFNQTNVVKNFNGTTWKVLLPSQTNEYCDAGSCGKIAPSYYVYKNGYRYSFNYYSDDLQPTIEAILSTISFTKE